MKDLQLYQLLDSDLESVGLLLTNCPKEEVQKQWEKFYNDNFEEGDKMPSDENWSMDLSVDTFAIFLVELGYKAERIFYTEINS